MNDDQQRNGASPLDVLDRLRAANPTHDVVDARNDIRARLDLDRILIGDITGDLQAGAAPTAPTGDDLDDALPLTPLDGQRGKRRRGAGDSEPRPVRRRPLPWIVAAAAAVVAAGAVGVAVLQPGPAPLAKADTPPALTITAPTSDVPAADVLRRCAVLARQQPALPPRTWRYSESIEYTTVTSYYERNGKDVEEVQVLPNRTRVWLTADGRAHRERVTAGGVDAWSVDGRIDPGLIAPAGTTTEDFDVADDDSTLDLPTDEAALKAYLQRKAGESIDGSRTAGYLEDLYNRAVSGLPTPAQQAAVWELLADTGSMQYLGTTTDRAGRPALVVAYDTTGEVAGQKRYELLIDPQTGLLLGHEEIALTTSPMWAQQAPAVMGGTTWLTTASTDTLDVPPTGDWSPRG